MQEKIQTTTHDVVYFTDSVKQLSLDLQVDHVGHSIHSPGHSIHHDFRPHDILHYVSSGMGTFTCMGKTTKLQAGDIYLFPKGTHVDYCADMQNPWTVWYVSFYGNRADYYLQQLGLSPKCIRLPHGEDTELESLFQKLLLAAKKPVVSGTLLCGYLMLILGTLMQNGPSSNLAMHCDVYHSIKKYIRDNLNTPLRIHELSQMFHLSQSQLFRVFKSSTGYSPQQYIEHQRIEKACDLINFTQDPIQEIAMKCGYLYESHFYKSFVKIVGIPPAKYRMTQQKET